MGGFYGSVQVRSEDRDQVRQIAEQVAKERKIKCLLGPALGGWVGIYPENGGQDQTFGEEVARRLSCDVFHIMVHDDDILTYWLWRNGELIDSYWSKPGYFSEEHREEQEAMAGDPAVYGNLLKGGIESLRTLLQRDRGFAFEVERLEKFARLLGISNAVTSYDYLKAGETEGIKSWKKFEELPGDEIVSEKQATAKKRKELTALKKRYKSSELLLADVVAKNEILRACSVGDGFATATSGNWQTNADPTLEYYASPWKTPVVVPIDMTPRVNRLTSNATAQYVAAALGRRVVVWDAQNWQVLREVSESDWSIEVALSDDGRLVAHSSSNEVVLTEVDSGDRLMSLPGACQMTFHPSGNYLLLILPDMQTGITELRRPNSEKLREIRLGSGVEISFEDLIEKLQAIEPEEMERRQRARLDAMIQSQIKSLTKELGSRVSEEYVERMRAGVEESLKKMVSNFHEIRSGPSKRRGVIRPKIVKISRDGKYLCCGTDRGFFVYLWLELVASASDNTPTPTWCHRTEADECGRSDANIYAIEQEVDNSGILFGGLSGELFRMDLETGEVRCIFTMPEEASITQLAMSQDGQTLGIVSGPNMQDFRNNRNDSRCFWSIWSYPKLLAAGKG